MGVMGESGFSAPNDWLGYRKLVKEWKLFLNYFFYSYYNLFIFKLYYFKSFIYL